MLVAGIDDSAQPKGKSRQHGSSRTDLKLFLKNTCKSV